MRFSRRELLRAGAALPFALRSFGQASSPGAPGWLLLGTDAGHGIYRARWAPATGEVGRPELAVAIDSPEFLAVHPSLPLVVAVDAVGSGKGALLSFRVDRASGKFTAVNRVSSHGNGPCFVSFDHTGHAVFAANYSGGSFAAYTVTADGTLLDRASVFDCGQSRACGPLGPVKERQTAPHLHSATLSPDNAFVVACDLGDDALEVFAVHPGDEHPLGAATRFAARAGSGPRHVAFHPNGRWLYCIHEIDCTLDLYDWKVHNGKPSLSLRDGSTTSTLADGVPFDGNACAEILVTPDGRFLFASTRGADEITSYTIDRRTGRLTPAQRLPSGGRVPRYIALDPGGRWLVCCNQGSPNHPTGNLAVFAYDAATGRLGENPRIFAAETPMCAQWL